MITKISAICIASVLMGSQPLWSQSSLPQSLPKSKSSVVKKGISVNGKLTDVEIKEVSPAIHVGLDTPVSQVPGLAQFPELDAFARIQHPQDLSVEAAKSLIPTADRTEITMEGVQSMVKDAQVHPERHRIWVRNLVFITQGELKAMYVCFNFEEAPPTGPMALSPFILENGKWKPWTIEFEKQHELENAFDIFEPNNENLFFHSDK